MPLLALPLAAGAYGAPTGYPDVYLEVAFESDPLDAPIWERIPLDDIRSISFRRGRSRELDRYESGGMTVVLDNRQRKYDPTYENGEHWPNIVPMKRIRLTEVYDNSWRRFTGFINEWTPTYVNGGARQNHDAIVTVTANDGFKVLGGLTLPTSVYAAEVEADNPASWWRLNEPSATTSGDTVFDSAGNAPLEVLSGFTGAFGATGLIARDSTTGCTFTAATGLRRIGPAPVNTPPLSVEGWFKVTGDGTLASCSETFTVDGSIPRWFLQIFGGGVLFTCDNGPDTAVTVSSGGGFADDDPHHVVGTWAADGSVQLYVDGVLVDSNSGADPVTFGNGAVLAIGTNGGLGAIGTNGPAGVLQDFAMYPAVLTADRVLAHYQGGITPWGDDTSGVRVGRVLDVVGWPEVDRDLDDGETSLQTAALAGTSALEHAAKVGDSEFGRFYMTGDGKVRLVGRHAQWKPPFNAVVAEFIDNPDSSGELAFSDISFDFSDQLIRNRVTVSRNDGTAITAKDETSIRRFGPQSYTKDGLLHDTDTLSLDAANYLLRQYKDPLLRIARLTARPRAAPDLAFPVLFGIELGDRVLVDHEVPGGDGSSIQQTSIVEAITETISVGRDWTFTFDLSPADLPGALVLDDTEVGLLDQQVLGY